MPEEKKTSIAPQGETHAHKPALPGAGVPQTPAPVVLPTPAAEFTARQLLDSLGGILDEAKAKAAVLHKMDENWRDAPAFEVGETDLNNIKAAADFIDFLVENIRTKAGAAQKATNAAMTGASTGTQTITK